MVRLLLHVYVMVCILIFPLRIYLSSVAEFCRYIFKGIAIRIIKNCCFLSGLSSTLSSYRRILLSLLHCTTICNLQSAWTMDLLFTSIFYFFLLRCQAPLRMFSLSFWLMLMMMIHYGVMMDLYCDGLSLPK